MAFREEAGGNRQASEPLVDPRTGVLRRLRSSSTSRWPKLCVATVAAAWFLGAARMEQPSFSGASTSASPSPAPLDTTWTKDWIFGAASAKVDQSDGRLPFWGDTISPSLAGRAYVANGGACKNPNSIDEPNVVPLNSSSADWNEALAGTNLDRHLLEDREGHINEARVALLDTACTACLHSRKWRQAYSSTLPSGYQCTATKSKKAFHFDNGDCENQMVVWRIPIFLQGVAGEVHSAELDAGATPLLFSIPATQALDMVLYMKDLKVGIRTLDLEMSTQVTRSKHIALDIAFDPSLSAQEVPREDMGDFVVYFVDEARLPILHLCAFPVEAEAFWNQGKSAPNLGPRGVQTNDKVGELKQRRVAEFQRAARNHQLRDQRAWSALRRDFTMAEQHATRGFKDTVIFEPFAGTFGITRMAAEEFGWTCSHPEAPIFLKLNIA